MELIDWITIAVIFALGWFLGNRAATRIHLTAFSMILKELGVKNQDLIRVARANGLTIPEPEHDEPELDHIEIKVEKHGEMLYAFRKDNDRFLGQGTSREELINRMAESLRNVRCTVVEGNEYMIKDNPTG